LWRAEGRVATIARNAISRPGLSKGMKREKKKNREPE